MLELMIEVREGMVPVEIAERNISLMNLFFFLFSFFPLKENKWNMGSENSK